MVMKYTDQKRQEMWTWFHENFMVPEECRPVESQDTGWQYQCGGPYDPREIMHNAFDGKFPADMIEDVVTDIEAESPEWARRV